MMPMKAGSARFGLLLLLLVCLAGRTMAFVSPNSANHLGVRTIRQKIVLQPSNHKDHPHLHHPPTTVALEAASALPMAVLGRSPVTAAIAVFAVFATAILARNQTIWQRLLYPGSLPDPSYSQPLPPGTIGGCPFLGGNPFTTYQNMNKNFRLEAAKLPGTPRIWKRFGFGKPMAVVSGSSPIKTFLGKEFKSVSQATDFGGGEYFELMFGTESMSFETQSSERYRFLQRLVGQALTPQSVARGVPALQQAAERAVDQMIATKDDDVVKMEDICKDLTLDVAWRQIIGLKFDTDQEIDEFHQAVHTWLKALTKFLNFLLPIPTWMLKRTKACRAKQYLTQLIEERIDQLETSGKPDGSTLSAMVFAKDDDDATKKLSRQQIVDNIFLLIVAGTETSSNTLTNAMLLLGMNPQVWGKVVREQERVVQQFGPDLTKEQLDKECPYLDGVIKETMRLLPVSGGGIRKIDQTMVLEGYQIPEKWWTMYSIALTHEQDPKTRTEDGSHMDIHSGFRPERWLEDSTRPTTEFMPYGAGHRFCLGHNLANAEMRTFLAVMARKLKGFELKADAKNKAIQWKEGVIITPKDGVLVTAYGK